MEALQTIEEQMTSHGKLAQERYLEGDFDSLRKLRQAYVHLFDNLNEALQEIDDSYEGLGDYADCRWLIHDVAIFLDYLDDILE